MASPNSTSHCQGGTNDDSSSFSREKVSRKRRKEDEVDEKKKKTNNESSLSVKKGRLQWTPELHQIFVNADKQLGDKNTPKNILELMGVEGLTRDKIASHLQKYRQGKQKKVNKSATAVHLQQNMAISNNYVASSEELHLKNHSIGNTMLMPMAGEKYGYAADPRITNWRNLLPPLDWSNYPFGTQNNTPSPLMPPPQQPLFRPMEENLQTHFLPNNMIGGIPPPPHLMVHHQGYSSAAAPAGDVGGVNQQQLHPNSIPNPGFGNVESYLNTNGQDPLSQVAEQEQPNRRVKIENRRETTENKEETSATGKLNTGGSRFDAKGETTWSSLPASDT